MKRTAIKDRVLPQYSIKEERANMITHIIGGAMGVIILLWGLYIAISHKSTLSIISAGVFGMSTIALYTVSAIYHGLKDSYGKRVMQVIDHCTIYLLIMGTYTPLLLSGLYPVSPVWAMALLAGQLPVAALGVVFSAIDHNKYKVIGMICYLAMGWMIIIGIKATVRAIGIPAFLWLLGGGLFYTVGAVLYGIGKKKRWFHTIFHICTVIAGALQAVCVLGYVL